MIKNKNEAMKELGKVLDKRIIIQKNSTVQNENGFDIEEWKDYKPVWAKKNNLFGKEYFAAKAINAENTVEFEIRYSKELEPLLEKDGTKLYRILYKNRPFDIIYVDNIREENRWLKIKSIEVN
ncbi:phage head closure protein [Clostridium sp. MB40-C1]|uniref:phage head closure protein n=1 Tax=Clostridium sp. MB40-C1 TaxID=3070996 RepID=UPI0027E080B5|nr:phage head closure protein [Clostridium sp. MB40-C1]WMJ81970.1 phage head closure protein [Clostridium sp. MB40-C1]